MIFPKYRVGDVRKLGIDDFIINERHWKLSGWKYSGIRVCTNVVRKKTHVRRFVVLNIEEKLIS